MPDANGSNPLSDREMQVLQMVSTGASNREIAQGLVISVNTVKVHMRNIFEKLEVQSRTEASMRAIQEGWVSVADEGQESPAESAAPPLKTYLVTTTPRTTLQPWQQLYLSVTVVLALLIVILPLIFTRPQTPYIPVVDPVNRVLSLEAEESLYQSNAPAEPESQSRSSQWTVRDSMPTERAGLGLVAFDQNLYAIGGVKGNDTATRFVEIYDPREGRWHEGASKPTAVTDIGAVLLDDKIYVPGGCTNDRQAVNILEIYDPQADQWTVGPALPGPRCGYGLVGVNEQLYLFGGWDGETYQDTIFIFSLESDEWQVLDSRLPQAIGYMGLTPFKGLIYMAGGYDGQDELNQLYIFDPETGAWTERTAMQEKRGGLGLVNVAEELFAIGGGWEQPLTTNEKYDPGTDTWTTFETPFDTQWRNLGVTVIDTEIYAVGGWNGSDGEYMDAVVSYNILFQMFLPVTPR